MTHLGDPAVRRQVFQRIAMVSPLSARKWGRMTPHQMLCHLSDSYRVALGERQASPATSPLQRTLVKWLALYLPLPWPHGVPTRPEVDQRAGGTLPSDFLRDRSDLIEVIERFSDPKRCSRWGSHPAFGSMSDRQWLRWGYLHADHHLRQFGV